MTRRSIARHAFVLGVSIAFCVLGALEGNPGAVIVVIMIYLIWLTYDDDEYPRFLPNEGTRRDRPLNCPFEPRPSAARWTVSALDNQ